MWKHNRLDKQYRDKESKLEQQMQSERDKLAAERVKVNARMNLTCHREWMITAYLELKPEHDARAAEMKEMEETASVVRASAAEAVDAALKNERSAKEQERKERERRIEGEKESQQKLEEARVEVRMQADTLTAMELSWRDEASRRVEQAEERFSNTLVEELGKQERRTKREEQQKGREQLEKQRVRMEVELPVGGDAELESPDGIEKFPNPSYDGEKRVANRASARRYNDEVDGTRMSLLGSGEDGGGSKTKSGIGSRGSGIGPCGQLQAAAAEIVLLGHFGRDYSGNPKGAMSLNVRQLAMKMSVLASARSCEKLYALFLDALPCAFGRECYLQRQYFRQKLHEMRTLGLACNAVDLAFAQKYLCASGDGTSDSKQKRGNVEYFAHIHEIVDFAGDEKAVAIDGFLESFGMTAKEEADTCFMAIEMLKWLLLFAIKLFAKLYPGLVNNPKYRFFGSSARAKVDNIGYKYVQITDV